MSGDIRERAVLWPKGRMYDAFFVGQKFDHHWGRTIVESDTVLFSILTLSYNPIYTNRDYAKAHGHPDIVVNPHLLFNVVLGLTVEDCSEKGGPFLGVYDLKYHRPIYPGTTIRARSETVEKRESQSNPSNGIVTWASEGVLDSGEVVVSFRRSNLVRRNPTGGKA